MPLFNIVANVFVGPEIAKSRQVLDTFITATNDFGKMLGNAEIRSKSLWRSFVRKTENKLLSPLQKHVKVLIEASSPVILERRRLEKEAEDEGRVYERPDDILQKLLDIFDKYGLVDLEDICGHMMILILASVHTTTDDSTNVLFHLAAFPEYIDKLFEEQQEVLDAIQQERQEQRKALVEKGEAIPEDLDPSQDRALSAPAIKRMVHMDSFVREVLRCRTDRLALNHRARQSVTLSNGMVISKGCTAIINMKSAHQSSIQGEDVEEFRPWRFVGNSKAATKAAPDFLPFGMGKYVFFFDFCSFCPLSLSWSKIKPLATQIPFANLFIFFFIVFFLRNRHACPGRFLAIQELKAIGVLMISRYSRIEIQDPSKTKKVLRSGMGTPTITGLIFTSRQ